MKNRLFLLAMIFLISCDLREVKKDTDELIVPASDNSDTNQENQKIVIAIDFENEYITPKVDTSTLRGKREYLMNQFLIWNEPSGPDYDTLLDLNFDGKKDYVIGYYGQAGTGIKNRILVWLFDTKSGCYLPDEMLSGLSNPTFYLKRKQITWFYIGHGAGEGGMLKWIDGNWIVTKEFYVNNTEEQTIWEIDYPLKHLKQDIRKSFEMIPPKDILETSY